MSLIVIHRTQHADPETCRLHRNLTLPTSAPHVSKWQFHATLSFLFFTGPMSFYITTHTTTNKFDMYNVCQCLNSFSELSRTSIMV